MSDLLTQLNDLIKSAEANQVSADNWRNLVALLADLGYGPRITPQQIVDVMPNITILASIAADTQEAPAPESRKSNMRRRRITQDDQQIIDNLAEDGNTAREIAEHLGLAVRSVRQSLNDRA